MAHDLRQRRRKKLTSTAALEIALPAFGVPIWGRLRAVRFVTTKSSGRRSAEPAPARGRRTSAAGLPATAEAAEVRERLTRDLREETEKLTASFTEAGFAAAKERNHGDAAAKAKRSSGEGRKVNSPPWTDHRSKYDAVLGPRRLIDKALPEKVGFSSPRLEKEEILEDYRAIMGRDPTHRPKKRPKKKKEDTLFPGLGVWYRTAKKNLN